MSIKSTGEQLARLPPAFRSNIGEVLRFRDLRTMAAYFTAGPGSAVWGCRTSLASVNFISVTYRDDALEYAAYTVRYAYEAFEALYANRHCMSPERLQIAVIMCQPLITFEFPGIWSLLKFRDLRNVILRVYGWANIHVSMELR